MINTVALEENKQKMLYFIGTVWKALIHLFVWEKLENALYSSKTSGGVLQKHFFEKLYNTHKKKHAPEFLS